MNNIEELAKNRILINGSWLIAKPLKSTLPHRIRAAIKVLKGEAEAVTFRNQ